MLDGLDRLRPDSWCEIPSSPACRLSAFPGIVVTWDRVAKARAAIENRLLGNAAVFAGFDVESDAL
jgi:hypothetical protein